MAPAREKVSMVPPRRPGDELLDRLSEGLAMGDLCGHCCIGAWPCIPNAGGGSCHNTRSLEGRPDKLCSASGFSGRSNDHAIVALHESGFGP
jgi:hypothetical protein